MNIPKNDATILRFYFLDIDFDIFYTCFIKCVAYLRRKGALL